MRRRRLIIKEVCRHLYVVTVRSADSRVEAFCALSIVRLLPMRSLENSMKELTLLQTLHVWHSPQTFTTDHESRLYTSPRPHQCAMLPNLLSSLHALCEQ